MIDQLIDNVNEGRLFNELKFLTAFPEVLRLTPRIRLFNTLQSAKISRDAGSIHVTVRRADIVNDSYAKLGQLRGRQLLTGFHITFSGEGAIDAGGVTRDWFASLLSAMFNPNYALFQLAANNRSSQINPASPALHQDYKKFYRFAGRMIARAVIEAVTIDAHMTRSLLKHLLGMPMRLSDLEEADEELYGSLTYILNNDPSDLDLTFQAHLVSVDQVIPIDLIDNGRNIKVTVENRQEFVDLMVEHHLTVMVREQVTEFCQGFHELIPPHELAWFTPDEFDLLICGLPEVKVDDLRAHCRFIHPFHAEHPVVRMFFNVLQSLTPEDKGKFLIFLTGSSQVPVGGFAALADIGRPVKLASGGEPRRGELPRAHTCWNQLDLPLYSSEEVMREKLLMAVQMCDGFGFA
jgi:E3 ubiquitin-protein ligase HUWE1